MGFKDLGCGCPERYQVMGDPLAEFTWVDFVLNLREGDKCTSPDPWVGGIGIEEGPYRIRCQFYPMFAKVMEGLCLLNPAFALELL